MANVLLVSYAGNLRTPSGFALDNGLANLAGELLARGHKVWIEDLNNRSIYARSLPSNMKEQTASLRRQLEGQEQPDLATLETVQKTLELRQNELSEELLHELSQTILEKQVTVVGFKCWGSDGAIILKRWCSALRSKHPKLKILLGGPICEAMPEHAASFIGTFDLMSTVKSEGTIAALVEHLEENLPLNNLPGVLFPGKNGYIRTQPPELDDLDRLANPAYDAATYPVAHSGDKLNFVVLDESRGCNNGCKFCMHPNYTGGMKFKSAARVLADFKFIQSVLGTKSFRLAGSNTPPATAVRLAAVHKS
jgi:hypothetical protein